MRNEDKIHMGQLILYGTVAAFGGLLFGAAVTGRMTDIWKQDIFK